ncbi:MAG: mannose-1-phosphate guanylyltransferase [Planctomycetota bacterium]|nr:mannose-1-phosphate guanylyltransferase [Planctomycetota bacterium]
MRYAMIMAGGAGTRLWPMSRKALPKQLIRFVFRDGRDEPCSLLELAAARLDGLVPPRHRVICTGERYRAEIERVLPDFAGERILGEPEGRDTINAVGFAAAVFGRSDPDAVFAVLTADHIIEPDEVFRDAMDVGFSLVEQDPRRLVTFAIKPTHPATGYGYVQRGEGIEGFDSRAFAVHEFKEKPDLDTATRYVQSGEYGWNSGMFIFHARTFMELLGTYAPVNAEGLEQIAAAWDTPDRARTLAEVYPKLPKTSVDYGIMEPAAHDDSVSICGVDMDLRWLDVGSWPAYAETIKPDAAGNRTRGTGDTVLIDSTDNLVITGSRRTGAHGHTVALVGCEGLIVVQTDDATLIMPADRAQDVKRAHEQARDGLK